MSEASFRTNFLKKVKDLSPEIFIEFADPHRVNGIPDVIIFYKGITKVFRYINNRDKSNDSINKDK